MDLELRLPGLRSRAIDDLPQPLDSLPLVVTLDQEHLALPPFVQPEEQFDALLTQQRREWSAATIPVMDQIHSGAPTRCKFTCEAMTKRTGWGGHRFVYDFTFRAVTGGSPENKSFFAATPSGTLTIGVLSAERFVVGSDYFLDVSPAGGS